MDLPDTKFKLQAETHPHPRRYVVETWCVTGQAQPRADPNRTRTPAAGPTFQLLHTFQVRRNFELTEYNMHPTY